MSSAHFEICFRLHPKTLKVNATACPWRPDLVAWIVRIVTAAMTTPLPTFRTGCGSRPDPAGLNFTNHFCADNSSNKLDRFITINNVKTV